MTTPEILKTSPVTPKSMPSDTLLLNFRATLDASWQKFDRAVPDIGKVLSDEYKTVQAEYTKAINLLSTIKTDDALRMNIPLKEQLESTIQTLRKHNAESNKQEAFNRALVDMEKNLAKLQQEVENNNSKKSSLTESPIATLPTAIGWGLISTALVGENSGTAIFKETQKWLTDIVGDVIKWADTEFTEMKKNPMKKFAEFLWWDEMGIANDMKEALSEKKNGWFDGMWGSIKVMFYWFLARLMGIDVSKSLTPEELQLAWIDSWITVSSWEEADAAKEKEKYDTKYRNARMIFESVYLHNVKSGLPVTDILDNITFAWTTILELQNVRNQKNYDAFLMKIWRNPDEKNKEWLQMILDKIFGAWSLYMLEAYNSVLGLPKKNPLPAKAKFSEYLIGASSMLKRMKWVIYASVNHELPKSSLTLNPDGSYALDDTDNKEEYDSLLDNDKKILGFALGTNRNAKYMIWWQDAFLKDLDKSEAFNGLYGSSEEKEHAKNVLRKILRFTDSFMSAIQSNPNIHLGMKDEISQIVYGKAYNLHAITLIYLSMQNKDMSKFNEFSTIEQTQVYTIVTTILQGSDSRITDGKNTGKYLNALENSVHPIPKAVKDFSQKIFSYMTKEAAKSLWESTKYISWVALENPMVALSLLSMSIPFIPQRDSVIDLISN